MKTRSTAVDCDPPAIHKADDHVSDNIVPQSEKFLHLSNTCTQLFEVLDEVKRCCFEVGRLIGIAGMDRNLKSDARQKDVNAHRLGSRAALTDKITGFS